MCNSHCVICIAVLLFLALILIFVIIPVTLMFSSGIWRSLVFPTYLVQSNNYTNPEDYGITGVRNMYIYITYPDSKDVSLGMWQVLPKALVSNNEYNFDGAISNENYHILLYLHGNGSDRTNSVALYEILREFFHIFAVDYRGYADSTRGDLTETNIVNDITYVYKWIRQKSGSKIFVWGHSLGTGVATRLLYNLKREGITAAGLVLETPFTSVTDVVKAQTIVKFYSFFPWFEASMVDPIEANDMNFDSKSYITDIDCPIMILHAEDDELIPYSIATELYFTAINHRNTYQGEITYHLYGPHGYGHLYVYTVPELPKQVKIFIDQCLEFDKKTL